MNEFDDIGFVPSDWADLGMRLRRAAMTAAALHLVLQARESAERHGKVETREYDAARGESHT